MADLKAAAKTLERATRNRLLLYRPYSKQSEFHAAGADHRERLLMAGNQQGKSHCGSGETAFHLTGRYPDWWKGRRFEKPIRMWAAGITNETTRDIVQRKLLGDPGKPGTGMIPADAIVKTITSRGLPGSVDNMTVRHTSGGLSYLSFKSYEQGYEKWQGDTLDAIWFDEEPPQKIYTEGLARLTATRGISFITFTPLQGMTDVVSLFFPVPSSPERSLTHMQIEDAEHIPIEERQLIVSRYPEHEREARARGIPTLGSGRVFPVPESTISVPSFAIPRHWPEIVGIDFGWDHPTAAVKLAWDRDDDCLYVTTAHSVREETPVVHAAAIRKWQDGVPVAWPHDGYIHDKTSGNALAESYREEGLNMLTEHATFAEGGYGVEAGVTLLLDRMRTGRFKVFEHLEPWWQEFRLYHRKEGRVVKAKDDLLDATRYAVMMLRYATAPARPMYARTAGLDWDPLNPGRVATYGGQA